MLIALHPPVKLTYIDNLFYVQTPMGFCIPFNLFGCTKVTLTDVIEPSKIIKPEVKPEVKPDDCSEVLPVENLLAAPRNTLVVVPTQMMMSDDLTESNPCWDKESFAILIGVGLLGLMLSPVLVVMFPVIKGVDSIMDNLVQDDDIKYKVE